MGAALAALHHLQEVETQLADLRGRIEARWRQVRIHEKRLAQIDADIAADHTQVRQRHMEVDRLDLDVKTREAELDKLRKALNAAKTNKEYAAILTQLNTTKVDSGKIEEKELELMTALDEARKKAGARVEEREAEAKRLDELRGQAEAVEAQSQGRLKELTARRDVIAAQAPPDALKLFERIASKNEGRAMALVIRTHPKREEFACESCNMSITLQQVNALMSTDTPVLCHTCGHILYLEPQAAGAR